MSNVSPSPIIVASIKHARLLRYEINYCRERLVFLAQRSLVQRTTRFNRGCSDLLTTIFGGGGGGIISRVIRTFKLVLWSRQPSLKNDRNY